MKKLSPWTPLPGPQTTAYLHPADELFYGGAAGGAKTQTLIGLSLTQHRDTLLLRRHAVDARAISKTLQDLNYGKWKNVGAGGELRTPDGRLIEVDGCEHDSNKLKFQGRAHDLKAFDEITHFTQSQYEFIIGWNRPSNPATYPNQRCRVVAAGNPPTDPEGEWVLKRWRAWLDPSGGKKAAPGELRWYTTIDGEEVECENGVPFTRKGTTHVPRSRSFIFARLEDNPDLMKSGYAATLDRLPEPLRSMLRYGDMAAKREDNPWQLIPTSWVVESNKRWLEHQAELIGPITGTGIDVARGGKDRTVIAKLHGSTLAPLICVPGILTPTGQSVLALLIGDGYDSRDSFNFDAIGVGAGVQEAAQLMGFNGAQPLVSSNATDYTDPSMPFKFPNLRSAMWWNFRRMLDPNVRTEPRIALPPDPELLGDLTAPRYSLKPSGITVEPKEDILKRIQRSTDKGDAVVYACWPVTDPDVYSTSPVDHPRKSGTFESQRRKWGM